MDRSTIEQVVLENIYKLAGVNPPTRQEGNEFPGYPLAAQPRFAAVLFYVLWPVCTVMVWWLTRRLL